MTAALLLIALLFVIVAAVIGAIRLVALDGYRRQPTCPRAPRLP
ncbi:hypothetical protein Q9S71_06270 [Microbacterium sp. KSW4-11]|uniref:Uncharacterized protein n=1 Tax=Microbacterium gawkjiense TaxID=3067309 RepID=A0ABU3G9D9_9MICO|nr:hypothetical protein [Microbacterium sp. KSW4-11]MDT3316424.1 hypothetical protein [Microbacterium sp. KSW4-11]